MRPVMVGRVFMREQPMNVMRSIMGVRETPFVKNPRPGPPVRHTVSGQRYAP